MKKFIPLLFLLLCIGCSKTMEQVNTKDITMIHYNTMELSSKNYEQILKIYNTIPFKTTEKKDTYKNKLSIHTKDDIILLSFSTKFCGKLEKNNKIYYSCDKTVEKLVKELDKLVEIYTSEAFYQIKLVENIDTKENHVIKLEESNQYIELYFKESVKNFRIHKTEGKDGKYVDIDLLYQEDKIPKGSIYYIQKRMNYDYIRITFDNQYETNFSIIPSYDKEQEKVNFTTEKNPL